MRREILGLKNREASEDDREERLWCALLSERVLAKDWLSAEDDVWDVLLRKLERKQR